MIVCLKTGKEYWCVEIIVVLFYHETVEIVENLFLSECGGVQLVIYFFGTCRCQRKGNPLLIGN